MSKPLHTPAVAQVVKITLPDGKKAKVIRALSEAWIVAVPDGTNLYEVDPGLMEALREVAGLKPREFDGFPPDWREQIRGCPECQSYKGHPIQLGICDTHRKPLWARERHDENEQSALGYRAKEIARAALSRSTGETT